jgi:sister-chromatid-cohesion protein PDS5
MATQVLGEMFAEKGGADLLRKYPTTWSLWNLRRNDKSSAVRLVFVEAAYGLLVGLPEQRDFVEGPLSRLQSIDLVLSMERRDFKC